MNDAGLVEKLEQAALSPAQQDRLFSLIVALFERAIDARSPKNRPPGRAGLKAEKGYYRLLYLENDFQAKVKHQDSAPDREPRYNWDFTAVVLKQLADIPELRQEIIAGIEAAISTVTDGESGHNGN